MKNLNKKEKFILLLVVEFIILLLFFFSKDTIFKKEIINIDLNNLSLRQGIITENFLEISEKDNPSIDKFDGLISYGPYIKLPMGIYDIKINYKTNTSDNFFRIHSENNSINIKTDNYYFYKEKYEIKNRFWLTNDINDLEILTYYRNGFLNIEKISIENNNLLYYKYFLFLSLFFIIVNICYGFKEKIDENKEFFIGIFFITIISSVPMFLYKIPYGHDTLFHFNRIIGIIDNLENLQIPSRMQGLWNNGNGGPLSILYGELFLYIPSLLYLIGFTIVESYQIFIVILNFLTAIISYISFKKIFEKDVVALFLSFLYTFSFYRLIDLYIRGAIGETIALTFFPLIICAMYLFLKDEGDLKLSGIFFVIGFSGIIQSHVISIEIVGIFIIITGLVFIKRIFSLKRIGCIICVIISTITLNLWFIVPFIEFMMEDIFLSNESVFNVSGIQQYGLFIGQILMPFHNIIGTNMSYTENISNELGLSLGAPLVFCLLLFFGYIFFSKEKNKIEIFTSFLICFSIYISSIYFPYDRLKNTPIGKIICSIQFPWRYLGITTALVVFATGFLILKHLNKKTEFIYFVGLLCLISSSFVLKTSCFDDSNYFVFNDKAALKIGSLQTEYLPTDTILEEIITFPQYEGIEIEKYNKGNNYICVKYNQNIKNDNAIILPLTYYKYFDVHSLDNQKYKLIKSNKNNQIEIILPNSESGFFEVYFESPQHWRICEIISLIALILFLGYIILYKKKSREESFYG